MAKLKRTTRKLLAASKATRHWGPGLGKVSQGWRNALATEIKRTGKNTQKRHRLGDLYGTKQGQKRV